MLDELSEENLTKKKSELENLETSQSNEEQVYRELKFKKIACDMHFKQFANTSAKENQYFYKLKIFLDKLNRFNCKRKFTGQLLLTRKEQEEIDRQYQQCRHST